MAPQLLQEQGSQPGYILSGTGSFPCPIGSFCPAHDLLEPLPCVPGSYNPYIGALSCLDCPSGYFCPQIATVSPKLCPPGFICSLDGLVYPNGRCPAGFYCLSGTRTSNPFRNDTTNRPYPCSAGTYCLPGVGSNFVVEGNFFFAQYCSAGFYCLTSSVSPRGTGLCPKGFYCPKGSKLPIPTPKGYFTELEGSVEPAKCPPGTYAPTIQTTSCLKCPPGTSCPADGTVAVSVCPPGTYRSADGDGIESFDCSSCPEGTWSKNWELRSVTECIPCAPGTYCPAMGITNPCSYADFPTLFRPTGNDEDEKSCLSRGKSFHYGYLKCPINVLGEGPNFRRSTFSPGTILNSSCDGRTASLVKLHQTVEVQCYENVWPLGSILYQRVKEFHGLKYETLYTQQYHAGYGEVSNYLGYFGQGSRSIDLPVSDRFLPFRNCSPGYFSSFELEGDEDWIPGSCEADIICASSQKTQARACPEGYACDSRTTSSSVYQNPCSAGYVCELGTTPDTSLFSPAGRLKQLCPEGYFCPEGTGSFSVSSNPCPRGYFCPTGVGDPVLGTNAFDSLLRELNSTEANPFLEPLYISNWDVVNFVPRPISRHDHMCFLGISEELYNTFVDRFGQQGEFLGSFNEALIYDSVCSRDHRWRLVQMTIDRNSCNCMVYFDRLRKVMSLFSDEVGSSSHFFGYTVDEANLIFNSGYCSSAILPVLSCIEEELRVAPACGLVVNSTFNLSIALARSFLAKEIFENELLWIRFSSCVCENMNTYEDQHRCAAYRSYSKIPISKRSLNVSSKNQLLFWLEGEGSISDTSVSFQLQDQRKRTCEDLFSCGQIDPLLYDLHASVRTIQLLGIVRVHDLLDTSQNEPRLDLCSCQNMFQCPDGTSSDARSTSVYDCYRISDSSNVLLRFQPFPPCSNAVNMSGWTLTLSLSRWQIPMKFKSFYPAEYVAEDSYTGLGKIQLSKWSVAILTLDLRSLPINLTYGDHYKISIYADCNPCPVRTRCAVHENLSCCSCQSERLPYFFYDTEYVEPENYPDNKHQVLTLSIGTVRNTTILFSLELLHGLYYSDFRGFSPFLGTLELSVNLQQRRNPVEDQGFFAYVPLNLFDETRPPLNLPEQLQVNAKAGNLLVDRIPNPVTGHLFGMQTCNRTISTLPANYSNFHVATREYHPLDPLSWNSLDHTYLKDVSSDTLVLNYLPYFSHCQEYDSHVYLKSLLNLHQPPQCNYIPKEKIISINQYWPWVAGAPHADTCGTGSWFCQAENICNLALQSLVLGCAYEEAWNQPTIVPRWFEKEGESVLFFLSRYEIVEPQIKSHSSLSVLSSLSDELDLVPVRVHPDYFSQKELVPGFVGLSISYYQSTEVSRSIVDAYIYFDEFCTTTSNPIALLSFASSIPDINSCHNTSVFYSLDFAWVPLPWLDLMNKFEFTIDVYALLFAFVGLGVAFLGVLIWLLATLFSVRKRRGNFKLFTWLGYIALPSSQGVFLSSVSSLLIAFCFYFVYTHDTVVQILGEYTGSWLETVRLTEMLKTKYLAGRIGAFLSLLGFFTIKKTSSLFQGAAFKPKYEDNLRQPDSDKILEQNKTEENEFWTPSDWKSQHILLYSLAVVLGALFIFEFSYSSIFQDNILLFIFSYKVLEKLLDNYLEENIRDTLACVPFSSFSEILFMFVTLGASSFTDFLVSFLIELALTLFDRLVFSPVLSTFLIKLPKWRHIVSHAWRSSRYETKAVREAYFEQLKKFQETISMELEGVEPIIRTYSSYSAVLQGMLSFPFTLWFLSIFNESSFILDNYSIKTEDFFIYLLFAILIALPTLFQDVFMLRTLEVVYGWKILDFAAYQNYRFSVREYPWLLDNPNQDISLSPTFQNIDAMCFSSQYFYLTNLHFWGMLSILCGLTIQVRWRYAFLSDPYLFLLIILTGLIFRCSSYVALTLFRKTPLWKLQVLDGTVDDELAKKLTLGKGRDEDLEREKLELEFLNKGSFKELFIDKNQPWILQNLSELLTPRSLTKPRIENARRTNEDYIRDLYAELLGQPKKDAHDSSDDEDEPFRGWSRSPPNDTSKEILLRWKTKALEVVHFRKLISNILENSLLDQCSKCNRTKKSSGVETLEIVCVLPKNEDENRSRFLEELIQEFRMRWPDAMENVQRQQILWPTFFKENTVLKTWCNICLYQTQISEEAIKTMTPSRPEAEDGSSSTFQAIVITQDSIEGRALIKWLSAARTRIGGQFPRSEGKAQSEAYARSLKVATRNRPCTNFPENIAMSLASKCILALWYTDATIQNLNSLVSDFQNKNNNLSKAFATLQDSENSWKISSTVQNLGAQLLEEGGKLDVEVRTLLSAKNEKRVSSQEALSKLRNSLETKLSASRHELDEKRSILMASLKARSEQEAKELAVRRVEISARYEKEIQATASEVRQKRLRSEQAEALEKIDHTIQALSTTADAELDSKMQEHIKKLQNQEEDAKLSYLKTKLKLENDFSAWLKVESSALLVLIAQFTHDVIEWISKLPS
eukprot:maker-scaffold_4-snap-gene-4.39-mRNA-1 protein AED:0.06 eAED:0.07 QI:0/0/0/1/0.5/0.33/3/0/2498